jgi:hypothetical protein
MQYDYNIPVPGTDNKGLTEALKNMPLGASMFLAGDKARSTAHAIAKRFDIKIVTRREADGSRIWRIE